MGILLIGGKVVTAVDAYYADVRIENDKIGSIGSDLGKTDDEIIDAHGCYIIPGGIDTHTHFALNVGTMTTADDFKSGTKAAIVGGTTTIIDYATQNKGGSLKEALHAQHEKSAGVCYCDYGFHMGITDWNDEVALEMEEMINEGVTSFKLYMAYKGNLQVDDGVILKALNKSRKTKTLICFHCENGDVIDELISEAKIKNHTTPYYHAKTRPVEAEREAITRLLNFSEIMDTPVYIVHLSSREGLLSILDAKKRGVKVFVETCPQYLLLNDSCYGEEKSDSFEGAKSVISPPLRKDYDQEALWKGISQGEIKTIGSDHCSFNYKGQKDIGINDFTKIPNGAPGVENRMGLIYTYGVVSGKISINEMVAITSTNAAKTFGMFPQKGTISIGSDADIVVWDPNFKSYITAVNQTQKVDYNLFEGFEQQGRVLHEFLRGNKVISNGELVEKEPLGKYIFRKINK